MNSIIFRPAPACAQRARKTLLFYLGSWVVGLVTALSLIFPNQAFAASAFTPNDGTPTIPVNLWGVVYYDANHNGQLDTGEYAISGGSVQLYDSSTNQLKATSQVASNGQYHFTDLDPGKYNVYNTTNGNWSAVPGYIRTMTNTVHSSTATGDDMEISDIELVAGETGENFNFGAQYYPIQLLSKRMLLASTPTTDPIIHAVPEPAMLLMLSLAGLPFAVLAALRRFRGE